MRLLAALCTLIALAAAGLAGQALWQELTRVDPPSEAQAGSTGETAAAAPAPPRQGRRWPALFGERQPPKPAAPPQPVAEPQPPRPAQPPLASLGYTLKGVVRAGNNTWAMVGHPTGDRLLRVGEELEPDVVVARIDDKGLWVSRHGGAIELMAFPD